MTTTTTTRSAKSNTSNNGGNDEGDIFDGVLIDDGTGINNFYLGTDGERYEQLPEGCLSCHPPERWDTGELRYYYRGTCIRCRTRSGPSVLSTGHHEKIFSLNLCQSCILASTPEIPRLRGYGDAIWANNNDTPKHYYNDIFQLSISDDRDKKLLLRAIETKYSIMKEAKQRRSHDRRMYITSKASDLKILKGQVACWGSNNKYDEYFGQLNANGEPDGLGVMFYSDGSTYLGGFLNGLWHISDGNTIGTWVSTLETKYEGTFLYGLKHGRGKQTFLDGSYYEGEFAKGYEHGSGRIVYPDGSIFTGKFRFGRRDGPGELVTRDRIVMEKGVFRDSGMPFTDVYPPFVEELSKSDVATIVSAGKTALFDPESLLDLCFKAISQNLKEPRLLGSDSDASPGLTLTRKEFRKNGVILPYDVAKRLPNYLKQRLSVRYVDESQTHHGIGTPEFRQFVLKTPVGFNLTEELNCGGIRIEAADIQTISVIQGANQPLQSLRLVSNKLSAGAINNLMNHLSARLWPTLRKLDLSYNILEMSSIKCIFDALPFITSLRALHLAGCGILPSGAAVIASFLSTNNFLETLDLAFNVVEANGAELLARALEGPNDTLKSLSLRRNNIGMAGGEAFIRALKRNNHIEMLCLADNQIGPDLSSAIGGRLHSSVGKVLKSICADQIRTPVRYLKLLEKAAKNHHH